VFDQIRRAERERIAQAIENAPLESMEDYEFTDAASFVRGLK